MRNRWHVLLLMFCTVGLMAILPASMAQAGVVAAWSFDSGSLTTDGGGNITGIADITGNHNATVASGTFLGSDSVAGQFGEALRFNGNNNLYFPNLTELMMSAGAPSYTVSLWIKWDNATAPGGGTPFATFSNWGEGAAGTVTPPTSRFVYAFGPNGATSIRAQTRTGTGSGTDIFAQSTTTAAVNDGGWHMLTWTFDTTTGELNIYFDGALTQTVTSTAASFQMADSTSAVGNMGHKGDSGADLLADTYLDEVVVLDEILDATAVAALYSNGFDFTSTQAQNPSPGNGATLVPVNATLSWEAPDDPNDEVVTYDVYFGTTVPDANCDGPPLVSADQPGTTYDPGALAFETDYYWRVDVIDPNGGGTPIVVKGDCWTFQTAPASPEITAEPEPLTVDKGASAQFTVADVNGTSYQWKKDGVDVSNGGKYSGANTDTLVISDVQVAEEGNYSVVVSNGAGSDTSIEVQLITCRLVGHWKLDGDLTDSVTDTEAGVPTHDGSVVGTADAGEIYDTGIDGQAFSFTGDPNSNVVEVADSTDYFNFFPRGFSVSAWAKDPTANGFNGLVSKQEECCNTVPTGWTLEIDSGQEGVITIRSVGSSGSSTADAVGIDEWHMLTATYDADSGTRRFYFDGEITHEDTSASVPVASNGPVIFGAEDSGGTDAVVEVVYDGLLDDVRIYSCSLTAIEVATLYTDIAGGSICVDGAALDGFDYNGDCIVNLLDFATLAGNYLNCKLIPVSACP